MTHTNASIYSIGAMRLELDGIVGLGGSESERERPCVSESEVNVPIRI